MFYLAEKSTEENGDISDIVPNTSSSFSEEKGSKFYTSIKLKNLLKTVVILFCYINDIIII